jgi:hypothetical protein
MPTLPRCLPAEPGVGLAYPAAGAPLPCWEMPTLSDGEAHGHGRSICWHRRPSIRPLERPISGLAVAGLAGPKPSIADKLTPIRWWYEGAASGVLNA